MFLTLKSANSSLRPVLVALAGTPGTGKSSVGDVLEARGYHVVDLDEEAEKLGLIERDGAGDKLVDVAALCEKIRVPTKLAFLKGHYAHKLPVDKIIVLRCHPRELRRRLEARGWLVQKVRVNVEAEAIDVILQEASQEGPAVFEIDTTDTRPEAAATSILEILQGKTRGYEPGSVDWSEEILSWY